MEIIRGFQSQVLGFQLKLRNPYHASHNNVRVFWEGAGEPFFTQKRVPRDSFKEGSIAYLKNR
jgi:hypothetical protein